MVPASLYQQHDRLFEENRFVYPVLSRRSGGLSIGVNLNPDKVCNFDCIYCQVNRTTESETRFVELDQLLDELDRMLEWVLSARIFESGKFADTPEQLRTLRDIAFSGDGEPTTYRNFDEVIQACATLKQKHQLDDVAMVLISNASMFHREHVQRGLQILDQNQGQVWAKLDAGTDAYYQLVERTTIPFQQILDNITQVSLTRPVVIQALFMRIQGEPPAATEQQAFCDRLNEIVDQGGQLKLIQLYTVARPPAESFVTPLSDQEIDLFVERIRQQTGLEVVGYGSMVDSLASD
ncbi:MAG TPA: radical SAM protein [Planctomycetaceae bacterium]|nr:radical SAM protein [Planctomycetaceae bacterium]